MENILVCLAWPYANGNLHVGHIAGAYLPADIFARYQRLMGNRVVVVSGSDSHGTPIVVRADQEGVTPREIFERYHTVFVEMWQKIGISYDLYTHTDTENHRVLSQQMFTRLLNNNLLFKQTQKQLYSESQQKFLPDRLVEGTCPHCGYEKARGDQCDNCGKLLDALQLINPRSRTHPDDTLVVRESEHYMFDLPALSEKLLAYLSDKDEYWRNTVLDFSRSYARALEPRAFTRDLIWGIPIPVENSEGKCIYVWWEALHGYLTATIEWAKVTGQPDAWKDFWFNPQAKIYNFLGKDNILFHTVLWPAILLGMETFSAENQDVPRRDEAVLRPYPKNKVGEGEKLQLPYDVPANQYLNLKGQKFSKSQGVSLDPVEIAGKYGADALRYYIASILPESKDADWDWNELMLKNNGELLAKWGNLVQRTLSQIWKNFGGKIPQPGPLTPNDEALIAASEDAFNTIGAAHTAVRQREALALTMELATKANQYLDSEAPWKTIKTGEEGRARAATQLYVAARVIDSLTILFSPFIPGVCEAAHRQLGYTQPIAGEQYTETVQETSNSHLALRYDGQKASGAWRPSQLLPGQPLGGEPKGLVAKIEEV
ncbi:MAG TPA: methionine--tRNA ligase [Thermoflexales bacterium]|nr:methionine--tRNA ligase [Thermoflexales bacterium]HQW34508.1 methionine--tRNA ligase [Thermoflexales bacterium]HQZ22729.1 methionine--tRNA ligase [Thermoflexales bacterium]